jgi:CO/xanthine dehydrogenase FAD-binding subunit
MEGGGADDHTIEEAANAAAQEVEPAGDIHASADFRRHLVRVLTRRALRRAIAQSGQRL